MYANLLAGYQNAAQANYGQQIATANRNQQAMQGEMMRQQQLMAKNSKFWNRIKNGFTSGLVNLAGQLPSMAIKAGATAAMGPAGFFAADGLGGGGGGAALQDRTQLDNYGGGPSLYDNTGA
jgi:hypothetical protein